MLATRGEPADPTQSRRIELWDAATGRPLRTNVAGERPLAGIALAAGGSVLIASSSEEEDGVRLWDAGSGAELRTLPGGRGPIGVLPGGRRVAVLAAFKTTDVLRIHDVATGNEVQRFVLPVSYRFALSPDGTRALLTSRLGDAELRIVELATGKELQRLRGLPRQPSAAVFSPDGRTVAAAADSRIVLWEVASGQEIQRLSGHEGRVHALAFSPDGLWLASAGSDDTVRVWEAATGSEAHRFSGHERDASALAFSPDGARLASGSFDGTALVWDFSTARKSTLPSGVPAEPELAALWNDLSSSSPPAGYRGIGMVAHRPAETVPYLRRRIEELLEPVQRDRVEQLVRELDDDDWTVRFRATEELKALREAAHPALEKALRQTASAEVRQRVRRILAKADAPRFTDADIRRLLRIIQALETVESAEATAILERLAREFPQSEVMREAEQTLERLRHR